jgi:hypothetical protein
MAFRDLLVLVGFLWVSQFACANAQSLSGLHIGDNVSAVSELGMPPTEKNQMGPFVVQKWTFPDGNDLSVTADRKTGKIVYLESDWGGRQAGSISDFTGLKFGNTSLRDIRAKFGNNGFAFKSNAFMAGPDSAAMFNCYQLSGNAKLVAAFVTVIKASQFQAIKAKRTSIDQAAKFGALILGDLDYLEAIWGKEKTFDPSYGPIDWN